MDTKDLQAETARQAELILSLESSLLIRQQQADRQAARIGQLEESLRIIGSGEIMAQMARLEEALRLTQSQLGGAHMEAARVEAGGATAEQLTAKLTDYENTWTIAEQNGFAVFLARFPDESSQGIMSLGDAWKAGRAFESANSATPPLPAPALKDSLAEALHYPSCWDTAAYPALSDALSAVYDHFKCSECAPLPAPSNDDASPDSEIIAKQVARWSKEVARLNDQIASAEPSKAAEGSIGDDPEFQRLRWAVAQDWTRTDLHVAFINCIENFFARKVAIGVLTDEPPSIRDSCDYESFHEDLLRLSEPGLARKQAKVIRSGIINTIDARVRAFAVPATVDRNAEPTVAWMKTHTKECTSVEHKKWMENAGFGVWREVAEQYTIPLCVNSPAVAQPAAQGMVPVSSIRAALKAAELGRGSYHQNYDGNMLGHAIEELIDPPTPAEQSTDKPAGDAK